MLPHGAMEVSTVIFVIVFDHSLQTSCVLGRVFVALYYGIPSGDNHWAMDLYSPLLENSDKWLMPHIVNWVLIRYHFVDFFG